MLMRGTSFKILVESASLPGIKVWQPRSNTTLVSAQSSSLAILSKHLPNDVEDGRLTRGSADRLADGFATPAAITLLQAKSLSTHGASPTTGTMALSGRSKSVLVVTKIVKLLMLVPSASIFKLPQTCSCS